MNDFVFVTALYDFSEMKRSDERSWEDYLAWFKETLKINSPMIIFTEDSLVDFIKENREYDTHIITDIGLPLLDLKDQFADVFASDEFQKRMQDKKRVECTDPFYLIVQYSKFKWLKQATEINPFDSKYFFWLDAGVSRFVEPSADPYPSQAALEQLEGIEDTLLLQFNPEYYPDLVEAKTLPLDYLWDNRSITCGSMFGGNIIAIKKIDLVMDEMMDMMLDKKCLNNEQIVLGYLTKSQPELFSLYWRQDPRQHLDLFQELS